MEMGGHQGCSCLTLAGDCGSSCMECQALVGTAVAGGWVPTSSACPQRGAGYWYKIGGQRSQSGRDGVWLCRNYQIPLKSPTVDRGSCSRGAFEDNLCKAESSLQRVGERVVLKRMVKDLSHLHSPRSCFLLSGSYRVSTSVTLWYMGTKRGSQGNS